MQYLPFLVGVYLALKLTLRLQVAFRVHRIQLLKQAVRLGSRDDFPVHESSMLAPFEAEFIAAGFRYSHTEISRRIENSVLCESRHLIFFHDQKNVAASISPSAAPDSTRTVNRALCSRFSDGQMLYTVDTAGMFLLGDAPRLTVHYCYDPKLEAALGSHDRHVADAKAQHGEPIGFGLPHESLHAENVSLDEWLTVLTEQRKLVPDSGDGVSPSFRAAFALSGKLIGEIQRCATERRRAGGGLPAYDLPIDAEVAAYRQLASIHEKASMERAAKLVLFALTAVLFAVSFGQFLTWSSVLILSAVVLFHETGHLVGMRIFGFRDLKILFLPFLGAVAIGKRKNITPFQRVIVALLGPVPGLLAGFVCYTIIQVYDLGENATLVELMWTLLGLNFFNLLPFMPLDGGQVLHALVFSRRPALEAFFTILGASVLGGMGFLWGQPVLAFVALLILISTKEQVRKARLLLGLRRKIKRRAGEPLPDELVVKEIFEHLTEQGLKQIPFQRKFQIADYLAANVQIQAAGFGQTTALILLYFFSLCLLPGFFAASYVLSDHASAKIHSVEQPATDESEPAFEDDPEPLPSGALRV